MVDRVLKALLLLAPISYANGVPLERFDLLFFRLGVVLLFLASLGVEPVRGLKDHWPLTGLLGVGFVNLALSSFNEIVTSAFLNLFYGILAVFIIVRYVKDIRGCLRFAIYAAILNALVFVVQMWGFSPIIEDLEDGGIMGNAPRLVNYFSILLPLIVAYSWPLTALVLLIGLVAKELTIVAIMAALLFLSRAIPGWVKAFAGLAVLCAMVCFKTQILRAVSVRWEIWKPTLEAIFDRPLLGYGLGMFPHVSDQVIPGRYKSDFVFNSYLQFLFGAGVAGAGWLVYFLRQVLSCPLNLSTQCLIALGLLACVEYPLEIPRLWLTLSALAAYWFIENTEVINVG